MSFGNSIALTVVLLIVSILFAMLVLSATRIIKVTEKFCAVVIVVTALDLLLDFDSNENGVHSGATKYIEWYSYSTIGLMMALVWLCLEVLRFIYYFMKNV